MRRVSVRASVIASFAARCADVIPKRAVASTVGLSLPASLTRSVVRNALRIGVASSPVVTDALHNVVWDVLFGIGAAVLLDLVLDGLLALWRRRRAGEAGEAGA